MAAANELTGNVYKQYNTLEYYFKLKETNDSLVKANEKLYNKLKQDFEVPDTLNLSVIDTIKIDSLEKYRKFLYMRAKVVANSVHLPNNYMELSRGSRQGVSRDLGVIDENNNVVGTVIDVSNNYAVVMPLLHMQSNTSARLKKTGEEGSVVWDGKESNMILLKNISKAVKVMRGDSVVTSGFTDRFPYGLLIGTVAGILPDKKSNTNTLKVKTAANFYNVQFVYIINNILKEEPSQLLQKAQKTHE
jgi:rod shape-determining protein MreC